jgi:hypothetical protein
MPPTFTPSKGQFEIIGLAAFEELNPRFCLRAGALQALQVWEYVCALRVEEQALSVRD